MAKKDQTQFLGIHTTKMGKRILTVVTIIVTLLLFDLFTPFGGNLRLAREWASCGHRPYIEYVFPGEAVHFYKPVPDLEFARNATKKYYCTPIEAERDGLSASSTSWDFPHLKAAGEVDPYSKQPFPSSN